jgi:4-amino-4-deoxy-L-arabinose transferase-like glycosyltransferase
MTTQLSSSPAPAEEVLPARGHLKRLALGRPEDPRWARPALWGILALAAFLYCWDLSRNGDANAFYAAAVLSGTESWKAFFFGSLDSASFITVDKPPLAFWVMGLSGRIFGFNSWSLLLPQAAEGVATVALLYSAVRRSLAAYTGERGACAAGLIAALALTLTPMTVAINRDDNPDTMLAFLMVLGGWLFLESLRADAGRRRLLLLMLSAVAWGLAFNTKMFEAFIPLPALAIAYVICADGRLRKRIGWLLATGAVLIVVAFSWVTVVDLIPASSRPFVGSSTNNTEWNLAFDYNGFGRVLGNTGRGLGGTGGGGTGGGTFPASGTGAAGHGTGTGTGGGLGGYAFGGTGGHGGGTFGGAGGRGGGFGGLGGQSGITRMFASTLGGQISWLIPFAVIAAIAGIILLWRRPRTDLARAAVLMWGGWFTLEFLVLSFQQGTQHPYYTSAMAPSIAALAGIGTVLLFQAYRRASARNWLWGSVLALGVAVTGAWAFVLLRRTPAWNSWLPWSIVAATIVAIIALIAAWPAGEPIGTGRAARLAAGIRARIGGRLNRRLLAAAAVVGLIAALAGPAAYAATPLSAAISGNNPLAGPSAGNGAGFGATFADGYAGIRDFTRGHGGFGGGTGGEGAGRPDGRGGTTADRTGARGATGATGLAGGFGGGAVSKEMLAYLQAHRDGATWLLAVSGSSAAAAIILQTGGTPVMAMGGFTGSDPAPTLAQFQQYVSEGKVHYVLAGGGGAGGFGGFGGAGRGGGSATSQVIAWVEKSCTAVPASAYDGSAASGTTITAAQDLYHCG